MIAFRDRFGTPLVADRIVVTVDESSGVC
jgi:hypothetical protein